jgi:hypothetical protein
MELTIRERLRENQEEDMDKMTERVPQAHLEICLMAIQWVHEVREDDELLDLEDDGPSEDYVGQAWYSVFGGFLLFFAHPTVLNADPTEPRIDR